MGRHTGAWKEHERRTARALGGVRLGATGTSTPDVDAGYTVAECKHRRQLPQWLTGALARVRDQAGTNRLGLVVLHEHGARDSIVCVSLQDWCDWYGPIADQDQDQTPT